MSCHTFKLLIVICRQHFAVKHIIKDPQILKSEPLFSLYCRQRSSDIWTKSLQSSKSYYGLKFYHKVIIWRQFFTVLSRNVTNLSFNHQEQEVVMATSAVSSLHYVDEE